MSGRSKFKRAKTRDPFINGWASSHRYSSHLHAIPFPTDLGDRGPALCDITPPLGWVEQASVPETFYCHTCLVRLGEMVNNHDERLTEVDLQMWRAVNDNIKAAAERRYD